MHSLQNRCHQLHFSYLSSLSSKLVFLSYGIHVWSSTAIEKFSVVSPCLFTVNHIMLPSSIFSTLSHFSLSPCETVCWILASLPSLLLTVPELFLCIVSFLVSLFVYHGFAFWLWFLLNSPEHSSDCCLLYTLLEVGKLLWFAFINCKVCSGIQKFGFGPMRQTCFHSHSSWCREHSEQGRKHSCTLSKVHEC